MLRACIAGFVFALTASAGQTPPDPARTIAELRQSTTDLNEAVRRFQIHLDNEIALHDRGYRSASGRHVPGADADLTDGAGESAQAAIRKLFAARMILARRNGYEPAALRDADRIQVLIGRTRDRIDASTIQIRSFFLVSASDLNSRSDSALRTQHRELLKARTASTESAQKAAAVLPLPVQREQSTPITLVCELSRRIALADSGVGDGHGRRLFYQEEWVKREGAVVVRRWAVAVNTSTGQHTLLRRYDLREFRGELDDIYESHGHDRLLRVDADRNIGLPSDAELRAAVTQANLAREELRSALADFRRHIADDLARSDARLAAQNELALDDDLPNQLRENLFAIRGQLAGAETVLEAERRIRAAAEQAIEKVQILEARVAWVDGAALEEDAPTRDSHSLQEARLRSDTEIGLLKALRLEALAALPPDLSGPEEQFPALRKDIIVRMRKLPEGYRQEIWRIDPASKGPRRVSRTIVLVNIDPKTNIQVPVSREVKYYRIESGDSLEEIYDENASRN